MGAFYFNAIFKKNITLSKGWGYYGDQKFSTGEKTKCMIDDDGIRFCREVEPGKEVYSFAYRINDMADNITLEVITC